MDEICWITTPRCSQCVPEPCFRRRNTCLGCNKLRERRTTPEPTCNAPKRQTVRVCERKVRDGAIMAFRAQGLSYGRIAHRLGLPRSTVQCVVLRSG